MLLIRANSSWNNSVRKKLKDEIRLERDNQFEISHIESELPNNYCDQLLVSCLVGVAAIKRYFESRKRMHREAQPHQEDRVKVQEKQRKKRSRRQRVSLGYVLKYNQ